MVDTIHLSTKRLLLRVVTPELAPAIADYFLRNADRFEPLSPLREPGFHSPDQWLTRASERQAQSLVGTALHLALSSVAEPSSVIGEINVTNIVRGVFQAGHLGYSIDRAHEGDGLMAEALRETIRYAFDEMHLHRLMANYLPTNERSGRLLQRLGFTVEGHARSYLKINGQWRDFVLTSLVNPRDDA